MLGSIIVPYVSVVVVVAIIITFKRDNYTWEKPSTITNQQHVAWSVAWPIFAVKAVVSELKRSVGTHG